MWLKPWGSARITCKPSNGVHEIPTCRPTAFEKHAALVTFAESRFPHINNEWTRRSVSTQSFYVAKPKSFTLLFYPFILYIHPSESSFSFRMIQAAHSDYHTGRESLHQNQHCKCHKCLMSDGVALNHKNSLAVDDLSSYSATQSNHRNLSRTSSSRATHDLVASLDAAYGNLGLLFRFFFLVLQWS